MNSRLTSRSAPALVAVTAIAAFVGPLNAQEFSDVPRWHWAWAYIQGVRDASITTGYEDGTYQPSVIVARDQMAVFIARAMCGGDANVPDGPDTATFPDVPNTGYGPDGADPFWAYKYVEYAVSHHVTAGFDDGLFHPNWDVTRGQMAAFMARAMCGGEEYVPTPSGDPRFPDVTDTVNSWCYKHVEYIASEGVTLGYPDGLYHPEIACARDQMAVYLCRAFDLPMPPLPYNVTDYFPLTEGSTWTYETADGVYARTASGTHAENGEVHSELVASDGGIEYWHSQPDGLVLDGFFSPEEGSVAFDPGLMIANGLDPGDSGNQTSATTLNGLPAGDTQFSYEFVSAEEVVVPAGTFTDCMKLRLLIQPEGQPADQFYIWVAKNVGVVKMDWGDFGGDDWEVLISAQVGGRSYPANTGPFRLADYWPLDVGSTWVFSGSDGTTVDQIVGVADVDGIEAAQVDEGPAEMTPACSYFALVDGALCLAGMRDEGSSPLIAFSPPIVLPETVSVGDYGSATTQVYEDGSAAGTATFDWAVVGAGPVSVEAGEFTNSLKLRLALTDQDSQRSESYTWLALGVGPIKDDERPFGGDSWRELTSAHVLGVDYPTAGRLFDITDYVDLSFHNEWEYEVYYPLVVAGNYLYGGYTWAAVAEAPGIMDHAFYCRTDEFGLHYLGESGWGDDGPTRLDPPFLFENGLAPGDARDQTSSYLVNDSPIGAASLEYTFDGIEAVSTEVGLFPDCMAISYSLQLPDVPTGTAEAETLWLARGVGMVQREFAWRTDRLTHASVAGVNYPPADTAFTVTDYLPVEMGNQWAMIAQGEGSYASLTAVDGTQSVTGLGITDTVYKLSRFAEDGYQGSDLIAVRTDGIAIYGHAEPTDGPMVVNPPLLIPNGARVGDSGTGSTTIYVWATDHWQAAGTITGFWQLVAAGPVTTSAGHFRDCLLIRWGVEAPSLGEMINYCWYARGVGVVKRFEVGDAEWEEMTGATIGGLTIPADVAPNTPAVAVIPQGSTFGFDFSAGAATAVPDDQDLSYLYVSGQDARIHSFDSTGISRFTAQGDYGFESIRAYSTFLPPEWDVWGQVWTQDSWVLGIGWDNIEGTTVAQTREGNYALLHITSANAAELGIEYVYPYGLFGP